MEEVCPNGGQHCLAAPRIDQYSNLCIDIRHPDRVILKRAPIGRRLGFKRPGIRECRLKTPRDRANVGWRIRAQKAGNLLVWTAPDGIKHARMRSFQISDKGNRPWNRLAE